MSIQRFGIVAAFVVSAHAYGAEDIGAWLEPMRAKHGFPALGAAVIVDSELHAIGVTGVRKQGDGTPVTVDDQFHLGSCGKAMTATLIGLLVQDGKLQFESELPGFFPEIKSSIDPAYKRATIAHLLQHRSGLPPLKFGDKEGWIGARELPGTPTEQRAAIVAKLLAEKPVSEPGSEYRYSNDGYVVLGAIIERITGEPFEEQLRKRVFEPLGMTSAGFGPMGVVGQVVQPWQHIKRDDALEPIEPLPANDNPPPYAPAGTVHANLRDWAKFVSLHIDGTHGETRVLTDETLRQLHTGRFGGDYAMGWLALERPWGGKVLTHAGSNTQNFCVVWLAPEKKFAMLVATNQGSATVQYEAQACDEVCGELLTRFLAP